MKAKIFSRVLVLFAVLMAAGPPLVYAQQTDEKTTLSKMLDDKDTAVSKWERMATVLVVLTISIGVLGAVTSALQKSDRPWSKRTTVAVGLSVSVLTVVVNTISDTDYRTLHRRSVEARKILGDLRLMVYQGAPADQASHQTWLEQFQKGLHQISDLEEGSIKSASQMHLMKSVYAQSSGYRPEWISALPADQSSLFFLGTGVGAKLQQADNISHDNVLSQAVGYFQSQFSSRLQGRAGVPKSLDLAQFVAKSAEEIGTYFEYDRKTKTYRYYTLWRIRKERAEIDLQLFGLKQGRTLPQDFSSVVQQSPGLRELYLSQPFAYLVGEYELEESRISAIGFASWRTSALLDDVQQSGATGVFIFKNSNYPSLKDGEKAEYSRLKQQVRPPDILLDAKIVDQDRSLITVDRNEYLLEFRLKRSKPKASHAMLIIKSKIGWQASAFGQCGGQERWAVKDGTDPAAGQVNFGNIQTKTIAELVSMEHPRIPPAGDETTRLVPAETNVVKVQAHLIQWKLETDSDFHLLLTDDTEEFTQGRGGPTGHSVIGEIPDPGCLSGSHGEFGTNSAFLTVGDGSMGITVARQQIQDQFPDADLTGGWNDAGGTMVEVVGVTFFDPAHGQTGRAPNNLEIHPIVSIKFLDNAGQRRVPHP